MTIGPRDKPYPIILHVDSNTGNPSKLSESNAIYVSSVSAITLSATTVCATNWVGIPGGPGTTDHGALTGLLDKDKDYLNKYQDSLTLLALKKREFEEFKLKLNQDLDAGKLKVSQLKIEMRENYLRVNYLII